MGITYQKQWGFLKRNFESGNLAHAFLFSGQDLESIKSFAKEFVEFINCSDLKKPCQKCQNCKLIESGNFPDLLLVKSSNSESSLKDTEDKMEIDISQIRNVQSFLSYKPYYGNLKSVIIENAERMNFEAQSCFLKSLEEPKGKTFIILISSKPDMLLGTISSRCQIVKFFGNINYNISLQDKKLLQELLAVIDLNLAEKFTYAKKAGLKEENFRKMLEVLQKYFRSLMLAKMGITKGGEAADNKNFTVEKIKKIIRLIEILNYQATTTNINQKLALEILLMEI